MEERVVMRATSADLTQLKKTVRLNGTNVAALLRQLFIKLGHLNP